MTQSKKIIVDGKTFYSDTAAELYLQNKKPQNKILSFIYLFFILFAILLVGSMFLTPSYLFNMNVALLGSAKNAIFITISIKLGAYIFEKLRNLKNNSVSSEVKKKAYMKALEEIENNSMEKFSKAQAIEKSNGDESKINSIYITLRTKELIDSRVKDVL
jgi:hypothetical protein